MIKIIATVRRKPGMTHSEFCDYIKDVHGEISRAKPLTVRKYMQNHVFDSAFGAAIDKGYAQTFHRDSVTELWFDDLPSMGQTFADPYTRDVIGPDGANFGDLATNVSLLTVEKIVDVPHPSTGAVKVMHFLKARDGLNGDAFVAAWSAALRDALPSIAEEVRGCIQSIPIPLPPQIAAYFRSEAGDVYDGVTSFWFDEGNTVPVFRRFQAAFEASNIIDVSRSFFALAREVEIMDFTK